MSIDCPTVHHEHSTLRSCADPTQALFARLILSFSQNPQPQSRAMIAHTLLSLLLSAKNAVETRMNALGLSPNSSRCSFPSTHNRTGAASLSPPSKPTVHATTAFRKNEIVA